MSNDPRVTLSNTGRNFTKTKRTDTYPFIDPLKLDLSGKRVFVTAASKGIGAGIALSAARAGASVIIIAARSPLSSIEGKISAAAKKAGRSEPQILSILLDISDKKSVEAAAQHISCELGYIDVLINNAGYLENWLPIAESDPENWWKTWTVNIFGSYLMLRSCIPLLLASPHPDRTVVMVASGGAHALSPGASGYQTSKLASLRLMEFVDIEYGEHSEPAKQTGKPIMAYAVHPGGVVTELSKGMPSAMHGLLTDTVELSADSIVWLISERRSWLAGRYVSCQWDMQELLGKKEQILEGNLLKVRMAVE